MHYYLGLEVWQRPDEIFLSQGKYVVKLLERFGMVECKSMATTMEINFKMLCGEAARLDLANPSKNRQLIGALMFLVNTRDVRLHGYTGVDWARNVIDRKSISRCYFSPGFAMISWMSRKHKFVALIMVEAKYIVVSMASCKAIWLRKLFGDLFEQVLDTTMIYSGNKSGIRLSKNLVFHDMSKHIEIKYHYIQAMVQRGAVRLHHISIDEQIVDILTKPLPKGKFLVFREQLGLVDMTFPRRGHS
eukprot:PITA_31254